MSFISWQRTLQTENSFVEKWTEKLAHFSTATTTVTAMIHLFQSSDKSDHQPAIPHGSPSKLRWLTSDRQLCLEIYPLPVFVAWSHDWVAPSHWQSVIGDAGKLESWTRSIIRGYSSRASLTTTEAIEHISGRFYPDRLLLCADPGHRRWHTNLQLLHGAYLAWLCGHRHSAADETGSTARALSQEMTIQLALFQENDRF